MTLPDPIIISRHSELHDLFVAIDNRSFDFTALRSAFDSDEQMKTIVSDIGSQISQWKARKATK
jgi:hypothetical protein